MILGVMVNLMCDISQSAWSLWVMISSFVIASVWPRKPSIVISIIQFILNTVLESQVCSLCNMTDLSLGRVEKTEWNPKSIKKKKNQIILMMSHNVQIHLYELWMDSGAFRCYIQLFRVVILVAHWACKGQIGFDYSLFHRNRGVKPWQRLTTVTRGVSVRELVIGFWYFVLFCLSKTVDFVLLI